MDEKPLPSRESDVGQGKWYVNEPMQPPSRTSTAIVFCAWVLFGALALGAVFAFEPYFTDIFGSKNRSDQRRAQNLVENDTLPAMKSRFWWGTGAGGVGAAIYWFLRNNKRNAQK